MVAPFAALEARVNSAVLGRLANAVAAVGEGAPFGVLFDREYADPFGGQIDASTPACTGSADLLGALQRGDSIVIGGETFTVERSEPDGVGFVRLVLYPAA